VEVPRDFEPTPGHRVACWLYDEPRKVIPRASSGHREVD
jgi:hypothetical protein